MLDGTSPGLVGPPIGAVNLKLKQLVVFGPFDGFGFFVFLALAASSGRMGVLLSSRALIRRL